MPKLKFDREIPPDEQLREISLILMEALHRVHRDGVPPQLPTIPVPQPSPQTPSTVVRPRLKLMLPKHCHDKFKPGTYANRLKNIYRKRMPKNKIFWLEKVVSIDKVPSGVLDRVVCHIDQLMLDLEFRESFDHAMHVLSHNDRRLASLVAERGLTHAARELGTSWRQISSALVRIRKIFEIAGFGPDRAPRPVRCISAQQTVEGEFQFRTDDAGVGTKPSIVSDYFPKSEA